MTDDIERRLVVAAVALREHEVTSRRCEDLQDRINELNAVLVKLREHHAAEEKDVRRLEGLSLARLLASLRADRDDALARERAEAAAAQYRVAETAARLNAVQRELRAAQARREQLARAPHDYAAVLDLKERYLVNGADPRAGRLLALADERGRLQGELRELDEARSASRAALNALGEVEDALGSASSWSTYDTFLGGGAFSSAIKHSRIDETAEAAKRADECLALLRTELADIPGVGPTAAQVAVDGMTRFVDIWFDNVFTDFAVWERIHQAKQNVANAQQMVHTVNSRLRQRTAQARARVAEIAIERSALLAG